jgi:hypothetical protein
MTDRNSTAQNRGIVRKSYIQCHVQANGVFSQARPIRYQGTGRTYALRKATIRQEEQGSRAIGQYVKEDILVVIVKAIANALNILVL